MTEVGRSPEVTYLLSHRVNENECAECGETATYYLYDRPEDLSEYRCDEHSSPSLPPR